jgi:thioredoxin-disulfide reductase/thioredoxin
MQYLFTSSILFLASLVSPLTAAIPKTAESESAVILGGGIGALTSALYLARAGLHPLVIEGELPGGLLAQSHSVQNWPGEMEIEGHALTDKVRMQAEANGARFLKGEVVKVDFSKGPFVLTTRPLDMKDKTREILADSCIIAMGTTPNFLGVPGEQAYWGQGVTNCAICDGALYRDQVVGVVGGGDAAVLEAYYLSKIAKEVHVFVRKGQLRANESTRIQALMEQPNVQFHYNKEVIEVKGDGTSVTGVVLKTGPDTVEDVPLDGLFLAIGSRPNTQVFQNKLELDGKGYVSLKKDQETSVHGVYAIGDIADPVYKQAISAAGSGAIAALQSQQFLMEKSNHPVALNQGEKKDSPSHEVLEIASFAQFENELKQANSPVVVDFYATWCGPCRQLAPMFEASAHRLSGKVKFFKVNVDKVPDLSRFYGIRSMPTVLLFDSSGKVLERKVGTDQIAALLEHLQPDTSL